MQPTNTYICLFIKGDAIIQQTRHFIFHPRYAFSDVRLIESPHFMKIRKTQVLGGPEDERRH